MYIYVLRGIEKDTIIIAYEDTSSDTSIFYKRGNKVGCYSTLSLSYSSTVLFPKRKNCILTTTHSN